MQRITALVADAETGSLYPSPLTAVGSKVGMPQRGVWGRAGAVPDLALLNLDTGPALLTASSGTIRLHMILNNKVIGAGRTLSIPS